MRKKIVLLSLCILALLKLNAQEMTNLEEPVNTSDYTEYSPTISSDGNTMIFESDRSEFMKSWKLYKTTKLPNEKWSEPKYISEINDSGDSIDFIGGPFLTYDNKYLFFTSNRSGGWGDIDIWYSIKQGETWSKPINIGEPINTIGYEGFPSVSSDGKSLYFMYKPSSPVADDERCFSIYVSHKKNDDTWSEPEKLPYPINTGCEYCPRIMSDNKTLCFSSKRGNNKDNFDLYLAKLKDDGTWSEPKPLNMINTNKDDNFIAIPASNDVMYFTIEVDWNEDIYSLKIPLEYKNDISLIPQEKINFMILGNIYDSETKLPIYNANISITNSSTNKLLNIINSISNGYYDYAIRGVYKFNISVSAKGYYYLSENIDFTNDILKKDFKKDFYLVPLKLNSSFVLSITFDNDKYDIRPSAIPELNKVVNLLKENSDLTVEISAHTDSLGSILHNQELSNNRAKSVVDYLVSKGINKNRLIAKGYGSKFPKYPNDTEANMSKNRRVEFKIVEKQ